MHSHTSVIWSRSSIGVKIQGCTVLLQQYSLYTVFIFNTQATVSAESAFSNNFCSFRLVAQTRRLLAELFRVSCLICDAIGLLEWGFRGISAFNAVEPYTNVCSVMLFLLRQVQRSLIPAEPQLDVTVCLKTYKVNPGFLSTVMVSFFHTENVLISSRSRRCSTPFSPPLFTTGLLECLMK